MNAKAAGHGGADEAPSRRKTAATAWAEAKSRDPLGHWLHTSFAALYLAALPVATAAEAITSAILFICALIRLRYTWTSYRAIARDRALWLFLATAVIVGLSILWIGEGIDRESAADEGLTELKAFRVIAVPLALWPVLGEAPILIAGFLLGVVGLDLVQVSQRLNLFGMELEGADRARGLIHPIQSGAFNLAALTWYMSAILIVNPPRNRNEALRIGALLAGAALAATGLLFAGSRGVWVAAVIVLPLGWILMAFRLKRIRRGLVLLLPAGAVLASVLALGGWRYIVDRFEDARADYRNAEEGDYTGSVGQRIIMARWAMRFFQQSPIIGNGAGSFRELSKQTPEFAELQRSWPGRAENNKFTPAHPHNAYLHLLYATGLLGTSVFAVVLLLLFRRAWRAPIDHYFSSGTVYVLLGWMIGTLADCYTLNGHLFGLFGFVIALTLPCPRPPSTPTQVAGHLP